MSDKKIVITGASRGLGYAITEGLAKNPHSIFTISRTAPNVSFNEKVLCFTGDITKESDRLLFTKQVISQFGRIDVLINNAGVVNLKPLHKYREPDYDEVFNVNVKGAFFLTQLVIQEMVKQEGGGHIINIGSTRSITGAPDKSLYSMSKFALRSLSQCINSEFKQNDITSTIICPGKLDEKLTKEVVAIVRLIVENDIRNIPEVIIGGML